MRRDYLTYETGTLYTFRGIVWNPKKTKTHVVRRGFFRLCDYRKFVGNLEKKFLLDYGIGEIVHLHQYKVVSKDLIGEYGGMLISGWVIGGLKPDYEIGDEI